MENSVQQVTPLWKRPIFWIVVIALALRLGSVAINHDRMAWQNERLFAIPAVRMLEGKGLTLADGGGPTAYRPPLYIFWLTGAYALFGPFSQLGPSILQAFASTLNVLLVYLLARQLWKREDAALLAAGILTIHPYALWHDPAISYTFLATTAALVSAWMLVRCIDLPRPGRAFLTGAAFGAAILLTATLAPIVAVLCAAGLILWKLPFPQRATLVACVLAGLMVTWGSWIVRNAIVFHAFVPLTTEAGLTAWYGNNPEAPWRVPQRTQEDASIPDGTPVAYGENLIGGSNVNGCVRSGKCEMGAGELAETRALGAASKEWIMSHPGSFLHLVAWRLVHIWSPFLSPAKNIGTNAFVNTIFTYGYALWTTFIYFLSAIGLVVAWEQRRRAAMATLLLIAIGAPSLYAIFLFFTRYRMPFEAILIAFAGGGLITLAGWWKAKRV